MSDYTPTTEEVRRQWAKKQRDVWGNPGLRALRKDFDRWLAEVKAQAWEEGVIAQKNKESYIEGLYWSGLANPYRQGETK